MVNNTPNSIVVPMRALLARIKVEGDLKKEQRGHFVIISVDDEKVSKSEKKFGSTPRWKLKDKDDFRFHPSSTIKIAIYRASWTRLDFAKHLVGQHTAKVIDLLDNNATIDLKNKKDVDIASKIKVKIKLATGPDKFEDTFKSFMKTVDDDISRLDSASLPSPVTSVLRIFRTVLRLTKGIMDVVTEAHPILKASWTILSVVYTAVKQTENLDDAVKDLAESMREMLGVAKEVADLPNIDGTTDVIREIGRTSLQVASLIHEYTTMPSFLGRATRAQFSGDLKTRTKQYQKTCDDLTRKLDRRLIIQAHRQQHVAAPRREFQYVAPRPGPPPWRPPRPEFQYDVHVDPPRPETTREAWYSPNRRTYHSQEFVVADRRQDRLADSDANSIVSHTFQR